MEREREREREPRELGWYASYEGIEDGITYPTECVRRCSSFRCNPQVHDLEEWSTEPCGDSEVEIDWASEDHPLDEEYDETFA